MKAESLDGQAEQFFVMCEREIGHTFTEVLRTQCRLDEGLT